MSVLQRSSYSIIQVVCTAALALLIGVAPAYTLTEADLRKFFEFEGGKLRLSSRIPSWPKQELKYIILGRLARESGPLVEDYMSRLSAVTGLRFRREPGLAANADIIFITDPTAILDLHDKPQYFLALGLSAHMIVAMQSMIARPETVGGRPSCGTTLMSEAGEGVISVALAQNASRHCIAQAALTAVGLGPRGLEDESQAFHMACILYQARQIGARTMREILAKGSQLGSTCHALEQQIEAG